MPPCTLHQEEGDKVSSIKVTQMVIKHSDLETFWNNFTAFNHLPTREFPYLHEDFSAKN